MSNNFLNNSDLCRSVNNQIAFKYDQISADNNFGITSWMLSQFKQRPLKLSNLLDLGCATGKLRDWLKDLNIHWLLSITFFGFGRARMITHSIGFEIIDRAVYTQVVVPMDAIAIFW